MKCPHCLEHFEPSWFASRLTKSKKENWSANSVKCPSCHDVIIRLQHWSLEGGGEIKDTLVYPQGIARAPLSKEIPNRYSKPYIQASQVLSISPEASAAISRRCLQDLLREEAKVKHGDLSKEIQEVIDSGDLASGLIEIIDSIRHVGNFGSHPIKDTNTGEIVEVAPGEAEWILDTLDELFDHYFIKPAIRKKRKLELNNKLKSAGKPPMK